MGGDDATASESESESVSASASSSSKRTEPDGLKAHRNLVKHIQNAMKLPGGPLLQTFAKTYKDKIKKNNPNMDSVTQAKEAIKLFDADSDSSRKSTYEQSKKNLAERKVAKKAQKAEKLSKESASSVTSVTSVSE